VANFFFFTMGNREWGKSGIIILLAIALLSAIAFSETTFTYKETELVRIVPEAYDADGDQLTYIFSEPLNASGEWQTTYDDAGTYTIRVAASDGDSYTENEVIIIVKNVNRPPTIHANDLQVMETERVVLNVEATDPDGDAVSLKFNDPLDQKGTWETTYDDAGTYETTIIASDNELQSEKTVTITVTEKNRAPFALSKSPKDKSPIIKETEELTFTVDISDPDGDPATVTWLVDGEEQETTEPTFTFTTTYDSAGTYMIEATLSDGDKLRREKWIVTVENINRPPQLNGLEDITVNENEPIQLTLPEKDLDGDRIRYSIDNPLNDNGYWLPSFDDAGTYEVDVTANDGDLSTTKTLTITVQDVDRAPTFTPLTDQVLTEEDELVLNLNAADQDGDDIIFRAHGLKGATFQGTRLIWSPDYDTVKLPKFIGKPISYVRLDHFIFGDEKTIPVTLEACGSDKCAEQKIFITVQNVNRPPTLELPTKVVTTNETQKVRLYPIVSDPDGDAVKIYYSDRFNRLGRWKTTYDDAGDYTISLTASDGNKSATENVRVVVTNINRLPEFGRIKDKTVKENETVSFLLPVTDDDGEDLTIWTENLPPGASFDEGMFTWTPDYDTVTPEDENKKEVTIIFMASDSGIRRRATGNNTELPEEVVARSVTITVKDVNRPPVLTKLDPEQEITALLGNQLIFSAEATDPDGDELTYKWDFGFLDSIAGAKAVARTYRATGNKEVTLTVSDGEAESIYTWFVDTAILRQATQPQQPATSPQPPAEPTPQPQTPPPSQPVSFVTYNVEG
jgi:PKD repeat protein